MSKQDIENILLSKNKSSSFDASNKNEKLLGVSKDNEKQSIVLKTKGSDKECQLYKNEVFRSKKMNHLKFTNFLPENYMITPDLREAINLITENEKFLCENWDRHDLPAVQVSGKYKERIKEIIREYDEDLVDALFEGRIRKSTVSTEHQKGKVRLISLYTKEKNKTIISLIFIDFYHLFIPSGNLGKPSERVMEENYNNQKNNDVCFSKYVKKESFKWLAKSPDTN
ncbi:hypothetical protein ACFFIF_02035 [Vagococcus entomophilus]|uniref:Uncharacterized protein n=1 Tax=Vagococcus entomophilus TaxID=1160095 RepID=A0A430AK24_9ENTE|nr:hypothetical protein [Vagococcus entomophilus]RSU08418.1 hypothetical protein CBF30_04045 [Vagococcus entomophilus]